MRLSDLKAKTAQQTITTSTKLQPGRATGIIRGVCDISPQKVYGTNETESAIAIVIDVQGATDLCKKVSLNLGYGTGFSTILMATGVDPDNEESTLQDLVGKPVALELFEDSKGRLNFQSNQVEPLDETDPQPTPLTKPTFYHEDASTVTLTEINKLPSEVRFLWQNRVRVRSPK